MMQFILQTLQALLAEGFGVVCTAAVMYFYWKCMTKKSHRKAK